MKKLTGILLTGLLVVMCGAWACEISTASLSDMTVSKDKDGKDIASTFKGGDTLYGRATVSGSMSKVTVKYRLVAEDVTGVPKGDTMKGSETNIDLPSSGVAILTLPIPPGFKGGKYTLIADMVNEGGEKKDSKSATLTIEGSAAPADDAGDKDADHDK